jgi:hypothetical protein
MCVLLVRQSKDWRTSCWSGPPNTISEAQLRCPLQIIHPLAESLGIPLSHVFANSILFDVSWPGAGVAAKLGWRGCLPGLVLSCRKAAAPVISPMGSTLGSMRASSHAEVGASQQPFATSE